MNKIELYPELIEYIYSYCEEYKTSDERLAGKSILYHGSDMDERMRALCIKRGWFSDEEHIKSMLSNGHESFKTNVVERILREHREKLSLNLCPQCFKITRTPLAKQCQFCFHDWH